MELVVDDLIGSTGLELKVDPGIPYVYFGFGGKQLWAIRSDEHRCLPARQTAMHQILDTIEIIALLSPKWAHVRTVSC